MSNNTDNTFATTAFGVTTAEHCTNGMAMLAAAGGDFTIASRELCDPVVITEPVGLDDTITRTEYQPTGIFVPYREDTGARIGKGSFGEKFTSFSNREAVELANVICEGHGFTFETMQVLNRGGGLALQVTCPDLNASLDVGGDAHKGYLTVTTAHDGSASLRVMPTMLRMFCKNVLPAIRRNSKGKANTYCIRHSSKMELRVNQMVIAMREAMGDLESAALKLRTLATRKVTQAETMDLWTRALLPDGKDESELEGKAKTMHENKLSELRAHSLNPINVPQDAAAVDTLYHALQPLTAYATRGIATRNTSDNISQAERRWQSAHMGAGAKLADRALDLAMAMV